MSGIELPDQSDLAKIPVLLQSKWKAMSKEAWKILPTDDGESYLPKRLVTRKFIYTLVRSA